MVLQYSIISLEAPEPSLSRCGIGDGLVTSITEAGPLTTDNVRVRVRQHSLNPISVSFIPANGVYMTIARMPDDLSPGEAEISLQFGDLVSLPVKTQIS